MFASTLIKKTARGIEKKANQLLKPYSITHAYTYVLLELYQTDGLSQTELQGKIGIEQPTLVRTLDRMARDGLILRQASPHDRRVFQICLTDKAKRMEDLILQLGQELNQDILGCLDEQEQQILVKILAKILTSLA